MTGFDGFANIKPIKISVPAEFYKNILPEITEPGKLKLMLCIFRLMSGNDDQAQFVFLDELLEDEAVKASFPAGAREIEEVLKKVCVDNLLLAADFEDRTLLFLNTPLARAAIRALQKGVWSPGDSSADAAGRDARPNIYTLYERNIGPLTPILAETLEDAERDYPAEWLEDAVKIAVKKNVRNWQYIEAILRSWKEKGRSEKDQRNHKEDARKYIEGDLADFIKH